MNELLGEDRIGLGVRRGYEELASILREAYDRASAGKGHERHAGGEPFEEQWIVTGRLELGPGALMFQIRKKLKEHARLPADAGDRELLDVINYVAAELIARRLERRCSAPAAAAEACVKITEQMVQRSEALQRSTWKGPAAPGTKPQ